MSETELIIHDTEWEECERSLRWLERDGSQVLQQRWSITRICEGSGLITSRRVEWRDIPMQRNIAENPAIMAALTRIEAKLDRLLTAKGLE